MLDSRRRWDRPYRASMAVTMCRQAAASLRVARARCASRSRRARDRGQALAGAREASRRSATRSRRTAWSQIGACSGGSPAGALGIPASAAASATRVILRCAILRSLHGLDHAREEDHCDEVGQRARGTGEDLACEELGMHAGSIPPLARDVDAAEQGRGQRSRVEMWKCGSLHDLYNFRGRGLFRPPAAGSSPRGRYRSRARDVYTLGIARYASRAREGQAEIRAGCGLGGRLYQSHSGSRSRMRGQSMEVEDIRHETCRKAQIPHEYPMRDLCFSAGFVQKVHYHPTRARDA